MNSQELVTSWKNLPLENKLSFRDELEEYLQYACTLYSEELDLLDYYFELTNDSAKLQFVKEKYPFIDWHLDLHASEYNYENFKDTLGEIVFDFCLDHDQTYIDVMNWSLDKNIMLLNILSHELMD